MGVSAIMINQGMDLVQSLTSYLAKVTVIDLLLTWAIALSIYYVTSRIKYIRSLPPGPWGLPVVGYLPWMLSSNAPHSTYLKLAAKHGDVTSVTLGKNLVVCLGSVKMIRDLFTRHDSTARPNTPLNNLLGGRGIIVSEGKLWKEQRQFLHQVFRSLGVRFWKNQPSEKFILYEIEELITKITSMNGLPVNPSTLLDRHIHNVICQLMMSFRFEEGDEEFVKFKERVTEGMRLYGSIHIGEHLPWYLYLPGKAVIIEEIKQNLKDICAFHKKHINKRIERRSKSDGCTGPPADVLDCYLDLLNEDNKETFAKVFPGPMSDDEIAKQMVQVMNDLFSAGMETSLSTLLWSLLIMVREPAVAARVRSELAAVLAPGEMVTLEHRLQMPYIEAVIYEVMRRVSPVPLGTTHMNTSDWIVNNHSVPQGSHLVPLINRIHMDPEVFPEPENILPERFLEDGKLRNVECFIPFGLGRRKCLGEQLARMELFLFFANFMNSFEFSVPEGGETPGLDGVLGATHAPLPFQLRFSVRSKLQPAMVNGTNK